MIEELFQAIDKLNVEFNLNIYLRDNSVLAADIYDISKNINTDRIKIL